MLLLFKFLVRIDINLKKRYIFFVFSGIICIFAAKLRHEVVQIIVL